MSKTSEIYINYENIEKRCSEALSGADDTDLALLGAMLLLSDGEGRLEMSLLEDSGRFDAADIRASVKFWRGSGIIAREPAQRKKSSEGTEKTISAERAHKGGVITHTSVTEYSTDELARVLSGGISPCFVDEAQKALGKMFSAGEVGKLVGLVDQLGFEEEAVLAILSYCVRLGKKSLSYAEKIAVSFHDEDILDTDAVHAQIDCLEKKNTAAEKVRSLFGFGGRALSATEKKLFGKWCVDWGFDMDIITRAYELTVDTIQTPTPKYTDAILTKWHDAGLCTLREVEAFIADDRAKKQALDKSVDRKGKSAAKNSEIDDWFEERLKAGLK